MKTELNNCAIELSVDGKYGIIYAKQVSICFNDNDDIVDIEANLKDHVSVCSAINLANKLRFKLSNNDNGDKFMFSKWGQHIEIRCINFDRNV